MTTETTSRQAQRPVPAQPAGTDLAAGVARLQERLSVARDEGRAWRNAYHSLRLTLEDRLDRLEIQIDRLTQLLEETEMEEPA